MTQKRKLAIVGSEPHTRENAPYNDPEYDIWSFSDWLLADWLKRCDAIIEIHGIEIYRNHPRSPGYWDALQKTTIPVYMYPFADPKVPNAIEFPLDGVLGMLSKAKTNGKAFKNLNCTTVYAIALGIYMGYEVIDIYGVELWPDSPYNKQRADFAFWVGFAAGRDIELNINCSEQLFNHKLYGIEDKTPTAKLFEIRDVLSKQKDEATRTANTADGALQLLNKLLEE